MTSFNLSQSPQELDSNDSASIGSSDPIRVDVDEQDYASIGNSTWNSNVKLLDDEELGNPHEADDSVGSSRASETVTGGDSEEDGLERDSETECDEEDERATTIAKIENIALSVISQLTSAISFLVREAKGCEVGNETEVDAPRIVLQLADRRRPMLTQDEEKSDNMRTIVFPARRKGSSAKGLAQLLKVVCAAHEALIKKQPLTKRDLFYSDVPLFKTQAVVDTLVDDLAATLGVSRSELGIRASAKGLFCGSGLTISLGRGEKVRGKDTEASLIPLSENISGIKLSKHVSWVLIVEKDAVFQSLCNVGLTRHPGLSGRGILITGKGYPDIATRQLVNTLCNHLPTSIPILILVDADPYGIDIASVYKFGSSALRHEQDGLAASRIDWIGVSCRDIERMRLDKDLLIPISDRDYKKAIHMLQRRQHMPERWRRELMHMVQTRRKAEIEILTSASASDRTFLDVRHMDEGRDGTFTPTHTENSALVQYLIEKINLHSEV